MSNGYLNLSGVPSTKLHASPSNLGISGLLQQNESIANIRCDTQSPIIKSSQYFVYILDIYFNNNVFHIYLTGKRHEQPTIFHCFRRNVHLWAQYLKLGFKLIGLKYPIEQLPGATNVPNKNQTTISYRIPTN